MNSTHTNSKHTENSVGKHKGTQEEKLVTPWRLGILRVSVGVFLHQFRIDQFEQRNPRKLISPQVLV